MLASITFAPAPTRENVKTGLRNKAESLKGLSGTSCLHPGFDKLFCKRPLDIRCLFHLALQVINTFGLTAQSVSDISEWLGFGTLPDPTKL